MKKIEKELFVFEYNECDNDYMSLVIEILINNQKEIMDFFKLEKLDKKIKIKFWDNIGEFREYINETLKPLGKVIQDWVCGRSTNTRDKSEINILSYKERLKINGHQNDTIEKFLKTIVHEFVHTCHNQYKDYKPSLTWYSEALATILSNQYDDSMFNLNCSLDDIMNAETNYLHYYSLGKYVLVVFGKDYALMLARNPQLLLNDTPRLYEEAKIWIDNLPINNIKF